ncbi:hypothetical protein GX48_08208 [Paracoccidioides brasiliensis]|nr:hypothetical protein GX48_08208 [Paracoccidioides brasiliensis]
MPPKAARSSSSDPASRGGDDDAVEQLRCSGLPISDETELFLQSDASQFPAQYDQSTFIEIKPSEPAERHNLTLA